MHFSVFNLRCKKKRVSMFMPVHISRLKNAMFGRILIHFSGFDKKK